MNKDYQEIKGNIIKLAKEGKFDVIAHGCNCLCNMGAGLAPQMVKAFGCDKFEMETYHSIEKLGNIDYQTFVLGENAMWNLNDADNKRNEPELTVVNAYTQYNYGLKKGQPIPLDYNAVSLCFKKMNNTFKGKHIGLPLIGCGKAGGNWEMVKRIMLREFTDCKVTVVFFEG